jgi:DNA (cytosine-5)-methyltransferase 1
MAKNFTFIDLCAGIGGLRIPFDAGKGGLPGRCVFTAEIDPHAQETYAAYFSNNDVALEETIQEIDNDLTNLDPTEVPNHDLLLAGFPCQPFSRAGKRLGFDDDRGNIFHRILDIIVAKNPRVILLENVRGLKSLKNADGTSALDQILKELEFPNRDGRFQDYEPSMRDVQYLVPKPKLFNARDFGLAQNRVRLFIIAIRKDVASENGLLEATDFEWPSIDETVRESLRVGDFLDPQAPSTYTISDRLWNGHKLRKERNKANGKGWGYQLFRPEDKYVATISARYFKDGSEALISQEPRNPRKLTPNEARRLQGFPDDFPIHPSKMQAFRQFGNAVPVSVIRALAGSIDKYLFPKVRSK